MGGITKSRIICSVDGAGEMSIPIGVVSTNILNSIGHMGLGIRSYDWHPSSYFLMLDSNNDTLLFASDTSSNGYSVYGYTLGTVGCTDTLAFNYNSLATVHYQDSCQYLVVLIVAHLIIIKAATIDDGTYVPFIYGYTDSNSFNFNSNANTDNGSCCTDTFQTNVMGSKFFDQYLAQNNWYGGNNSDVENPLPL